MVATSWLLDGRILRAGLEGVRGVICVFGLRGLTDLNACCRAAGLGQRRGLGSHVQKSEGGMYRVAGRGEGGREGGKRGG